MNGVDTGQTRDCRQLVLGRKKLLLFKRLKKVFVHR
jgi:hypothetical protein